MCHHAILCYDLMLATELALKTGQPSLLTLPPSVCPSLCPQVPREHWWDSAQCYQPLLLKGIIVLSCWSSVNQWDALFPLQHVGHGAPACTDVQWLRPAEHRSYLCVSCACEKDQQIVTFHYKPWSYTNKEGTGYCDITELPYFISSEISHSAFSLFAQASMKDSLLSHVQASLSCTVNMACVFLLLHQ